MKKILILAVVIFFTDFLLFAQVESPDTLFNEGKKALEQKLFSSSERIFNRFIASFPEDPRIDSADFFLGMTYFYLKNFKKSLDLFQKFPRKYPQSALKDKSYYWLGSNEFGLFKFEKAYDAFLIQTQKKVEPNIVSKSLYFAGLSAEKIGKKKLSLEVLSRLAPLDSESDLRLQGIFKWAVLALEQKQFSDAQAAINIFKKDYQKSPLYNDIRIVEAELLVMEGDPKSALNLLVLLENDSAISNVIKEKVYYRKGSLLYSLEGSKKEALLTFEFLIKKFPNTEYKTEVLNILSKNYTEEKRYPEAQKALEELLSANPDAGISQRLKNNLAIVLSLQNKWVMAGKLWNDAKMGPDKNLSAESLYSAFFAYLKAKEFNQATLIGEDYLKSFPTHSKTESLLKELAITYGNVGRTKDRSRILFSLIDRYPKSKQIAEYLLLRGADYEQQENYAGAIADYQRILKEFPNELVRKEAQYRLGFSYSQKGEFLRAEGYFFTLGEELKSGELYEKCLLARAMAFTNAERFDKAIAVFERLIKEAPNSNWTQQGKLHLANVLFKTGKHEISRNQLLDLYKTTKTEDLKSQALWEMASNSMARRFYKEAEEDWTLYVTEFPNSDKVQKARFQKGIAAFEDQRFAKALEYFDHALKFPGLKEELLFQKGLTFLKLGFFSDAKNTWESLSAIFPLSSKPAEGWFKWGDFLWETGKQLDGALLWEQLIARWPNTTWADLALPKTVIALFQSGQSQKGFGLVSKIFKNEQNPERSYVIAKTLGSILINLGDLKIWNSFLPEFLLLKPSVTIKSEIYLAYARSIIDSQETEALKILKEITQVGSFENQKGEAFLIAAEYFKRIKKDALARQYFSTASEIKDSFIKARALFQLAKLDLNEGKNQQALQIFKQLGNSNESWGDLQANALYEGWKLALVLKDPNLQRELVAVLKKNWPSHSLTNLIY